MHVRMFPDESSRCRKPYDYRRKLLVKTLKFHACCMFEEMFERFAKKVRDPDPHRTSDFLAAV